MRYTIKKADVIKALKTEYLFPGHFVDYNLRHSKDKATKKCHVCAVGAILRRNLASKISYRDIALFGENLARNGTCQPNDLRLAPLKNVFEDAIKFNRKNNYLAQLSYIFDGLAYNWALFMPEIREHCISFVNECFPENIKVSIPK